MRRNIGDLCRLQGCLSQGRTHSNSERSTRGTLFGPRPGSKSAGIATHLAIDRGAPVAGMFELFKHEYPGTLTEDQTVPVAVKRPTGLLGHGGLLREQAEFAPEQKFLHLDLGSSPASNHQVCGPVRD